MQPGEALVWQEPTPTLQTPLFVSSLVGSSVPLCSLPSVLISVLLFCSVVVQFRCWFGLALESTARVSKLCVRDALAPLQTKNGDRYHRYKPKHEAVSQAVSQSGSPGSQSVSQSVCTVATSVRLSVSKYVHTSVRTHFRALSRRCRFVLRCVVCCGLWVVGCYPMDPGP